MKIMSRDLAIPVTVTGATALGTSVDKPYLVTFEIRASDLSSAVRFAKELCGVHNVEDVVQKHRMTNYGTEWHKPRPRSVNPKKRSKNNAKNRMEN